MKLLAFLFCLKSHQTKHLANFSTSEALRELTSLRNLELNSSLWQGSVSIIAPCFMTLTKLTMLDIGRNVFFANFSAM